MAKIRMPLEVVIQSKDLMSPDGKKKKEEEEENEKERIISWVAREAERGEDYSQTSDWPQSAGGG